MKKVACCGAAIPSRLSSTDGAETMDCSWERAEPTTNEKMKRANTFFGVGWGWGGGSGGGWG
jgi:hypothetical protein